MVDFTKLGAQAASQGKDMTKPQQGGGGGDYTPPAEGACNLRFIGYVELGKQKDTFQGKPVEKEKVQLVFELSGRKHPPKVMDDGTKVPVRIIIEENLSLNEKANLLKLFNVMNYAGKAVHMVQLLGGAYIGDVVHRKYAKRGEDKAKPETWTGVDAGLRHKTAGYTIRPPRFEVRDAETGEGTGEFKVVAVDPPISPLRCFIWAQADMEQWNSLHIDGEYPERKNDKGEVIAPAKSKNVFQNAIKSAVNFKGSPIYTLLQNNGKALDLPDAEVPGEDEPDACGTPTQAPWDTVGESEPSTDDILNGVV